MPKVTYSSSKGFVQEPGSGVKFSGAIVQGQLGKLFTHTATSGNLTLTAADSGAVVAIEGNASSQIITIPSATDAPGFRCTFCITVSPANALDVEQSGTPNNFNAINTVSGAVSDGREAAVQLRFKATTSAGDFAEVYSDGVQYYVNSQTTATDTIIPVT